MQYIIVYHRYGHHCSIVEASKSAPLDLNPCRQSTAKQLNTFIAINLDRHDTWKAPEVWHYATFGHIRNYSAIFAEN